MLSFVDNGLLFTWRKYFSFCNSLLFCSYNVISNLLSKFGFIVKHSKTEVFYFSRSHSLFNPPPLDLSFISSPVLYPKKSWKYLDFIFDRKLSFHQYIDFYSNKTISTVKCIKSLEIWLEIWFLIRSIFSIGVAYSWLLFMVSNCSIITKLLYYIHWRCWVKCREKLLSEY